jgi:hypothetical protein
MQPIPQGAWFSSGALQVHLILHLRGSFRAGKIDNDDCHFRTEVICHGST